MGNKITLQRIKKVTSDELELARRYYGLISVLNDLSLTERELQLVSFVALRGDVNEGKEEFCEKYGTSIATINNMVSRLRKIGVMVKVNGKIKVNSSICPSFENGLVLQISMLQFDKIEKVYGL